MLFAAALAPDRAPLADEWGYHPTDGATARTNPPLMTWVHEKEAAGYGLQWADNSEFRNAGSVQVPWSAYTHSSPLKADTWYWRYRIVDSEGKESAWSQTRRFRIDHDAVVFAKPALRDLKNRIPERHPRLFVRREDLPKLKAYIQGAGREPWEKLLARAGGWARGWPAYGGTVRSRQRQRCGDKPVLVVEPRSNPSGGFRGRDARVRLSAYRRGEVSGGCTALLAVAGALGRRRTDQLHTELRGGKAAGTPAGPRLRLGIRRTQRSRARRGAARVEAAGRGCMEFLGSATGQGTSQPTLRQPCKPALAQAGYHRRNSRRGSMA